MAADFLEELARSEVPAPPADLAPQVHRRVNTALIAMHVGEFALRALPYAALHFGLALWEAVYFTLTGRYAVRPEEENGETGRHDHSA